MHPKMAEGVSTSAATQGDQGKQMRYRTTSGNRQVVSMLQIRKQAKQQLEEEAAQHRKRNGSSNSVNENRGSLRKNSLLKNSETRNSIKFGKGNVILPTISGGALVVPGVALEIADQYSEKRARHSYEYDNADKSQMYVKRYSGLYLPIVSGSVPGTPEAPSPVDKANDLSHDTTLLRASAKSGVGNDKSMQRHRSAPRLYPNDKDMRLAELLVVKGSSGKELDDRQARVERFAAELKAQKERALRAKQTLQKQSLLLGIEVVDVPDQSGVKIIEVKTGSAADAAGLQTGDIITHFDIYAITNRQDFRRAVKRFTVGDAVSIGILHAKQQAIASLRIGAVELSWSQIDQLREQAAQEPKVTARLQELHYQHQEFSKESSVITEIKEAEHFSLTVAKDLEQIARSTRTSKELMTASHNNALQEWAALKCQVGIEVIDIRGGCKIIRVVENGPAMKAGIQEGDVIQSLNDQPIANKAAFEALFRKMAILNGERFDSTGNIEKVSFKSTAIRPLDKVDFLVTRNGNSMIITIIVGSPGLSFEDLAEIKRQIEVHDAEIRAEQLRRKEKDTKLKARIQQKKAEKRQLRRYVTLTENEIAETDEQLTTRLATKPPTLDDKNSLDSASISSANFDTSTIDEKDSSVGAIDVV